MALVKNSFLVSCATVAQCDFFFFAEHFVILFDDVALFEIRHSSYKINLSPVPCLGNMRPIRDERTK